MSSSRNGADSTKELFLDILTKEEKEALLTKKMEEIRKKNEALKKRHQEIEADKEVAQQLDKKEADKQANSPRKEFKSEMDKRYDNYESHLDSGSTYHDGKIDSGRFIHHDNQRDFESRGSHNSRVDRGRRRHEDGRIGSGRFTHQDDQRDFDSRQSNYDSHVDRGRRQHDDSRIGSGRFTQQDNQRDFDTRPGNRNIQSGKPRGRGRGRGQQLAQMSKATLKAEDYEAKRKANAAKYESELKSPDGPPPDPGYSFLADPRREGPAPDSNREGSRRHQRNFGGTDFSDVKSKMQWDRERGGRQHRGIPRSKMDTSLTMTGRERLQDKEWREERKRIDQERLQRHKDSHGNWKRDWDAAKHEPEPEEFSSPRQVQPPRRPAGRIGSGRFDHGQTDTRRRGNALHTRGRGGGTRGHGGQRPQNFQSRNRFSSSGSDDGRTVERQNDTLLVKIDNEFSSPTEERPPKRTPKRTIDRQSKSKQERTEKLKGKVQTPLLDVPQDPSRSKEQNVQETDTNPIPHQETTVESLGGGNKINENVNGDKVQNEKDHHGDENNKVKGKDDEECHEDDDEWEDVPEDREFYDVEDVSCTNITQEAPVEKVETEHEEENQESENSNKMHLDTDIICPTSPEITTPVGHIKVIDWAAEMDDMSEGSRSSGNSPRDENVDNNDQSGTYKIPKSDLEQHLHKSKPEEENSTSSETQVGDTTFDQPANIEPESIQSIVDTPENNLTVDDALTSGDPDQEADSAEQVANSDSSEVQQDDTQSENVSRESQDAES